MNDQLTLSGDTLSVERKECAKYDGCGRDADYVATVTHYEKGMVEVLCCESCRDEFAEWVPSDRIRALERSEKYTPETTEEPDT